MANVSLIDLSKLAGTSVTHIENTYLKYSETQSRTAALKNFSVNSDGTMNSYDLQQSKSQNCFRINY